jgi:hypothetical protein
MALTIDDFFDKLMDGIEAVIPRTAPVILFKRHKAPIVLDLSPGAVRYFKLGVGSVLPQDSAGPHSDGVSAWYGTDTFLVKIWYPAVWVIDGDSTARGIEWLKLQDMIDLNKAICYGDILATLGASYESPQFKGAYQEGNFWVLSYKTAWMELLTS